MGANRSSRSSSGQVEQDLIILRALVELFGDDGSEGREGLLPSDARASLLVLAA
jgi:hypothetical protein